MWFQQWPRLHRYGYLCMTFDGESQEVQIRLFNRSFDFIPHLVLWLVLHKYGIPSELIQLIKSLHEETKAEINVDLYRKICLKTRFVLASVFWEPTNEFPINSNKL